MAALGHRVGLGHRGLAQVAALVLIVAAVAAGAGGSPPGDVAAATVVVPSAPLGGGFVQAAFGGAVEDPISVTVDGFGNVYAVSAFTDAVYRIPPDGPLVEVPTGLSSASAVAAAPNGDLYVAGGDFITKIPFEGAPERIAAVSETVSAIAIDPDGDLFVALPEKGRVVQISPSGLQIDVGTGWKDPLDVSLDADGDLWVADAEIGVVRVHPDDTQETVVAGPNLNTADVDPAGNLYVGNSLVGGKVTVYPVSGSSFTVGSGFDEIQQLAVSQTGEVYVGDATLAQVQQISLAPLAVVQGRGRVAVSWMPPTQTGGSPITAYTVTAIDRTEPSGGGPTCTTTSTSCVMAGLAAHEYSFTVKAANAAGSGPASAPSASVEPLGALVPAAPLGVISLPGSVGSGLEAPEGVAVDRAGDVYVADTGNGRVVAFRTDGTTATIGSGFERPRGVAVDVDGNVYVADTGNDRVVVVPPGGAPKPIGSGFSGPQAVAVDSRGNVYVADTGNNRVVIVPPGGSPKPIGSGLAAPRGVAVAESGSVYVADTGNDRIVAISPGGTQSSIGSGWNGPSGVSVDLLGAVYVADTYNNRVEVIPADSPQADFGFGWELPVGVAASAAGGVYVVELTAGDVSAFELHPTSQPAGATSISVRWEAPMTDGGSPVTGYTVTATDVTDASGGGQTCTTTDITCTVTGLTSGDSYTFTVVATNALGDSAPTAPSEAVAPGAPPGEVDPTTTTPPVAPGEIPLAPPAYGVPALPLYTG